MSENGVSTYGSLGEGLWVVIGVNGDTDLVLMNIIMTILKELRFNNAKKYNSLKGEEVKDQGEEGDCKEYSTIGPRFLGDKFYIKTFITSTHS